ncbi:MAG: S8/S53 family peptidase [Ktedonobacteraceae bacterium]|nr:S8/S53 family peptidase [Ktedonobacteraceae bacterium]
MQRNIVFRGALMLIVVAAIAAGLYNVTILMAHARPSQRIPISAQTVPLLSHARLVGAAKPDAQLHLSIGLRPRNEQKLNRLLNDIYNPRSPLYHHFLTPAQFTAAFGPTAAQQRQVADYLRSQGMTVTQIASNGLLINATATVAQAEATFGMQINDYQLGSRKFYANATAPAVPDTIAPLILSIGGLDNSMQMHPLHQAAGQPRVGYKANDLLNAYNIASLRQAGIDGSGQTIALFELDGYERSDIAQFFQDNQLGQPDIKNVLVDGFDGSAGQGAIEVELDIEVIAEIAPRATQVVYEGPNTTQGVNDTYNRIVNDNQAQVVSISWGECEAQAGLAELQTLNNIFKQAAAQGISLFAASGDSGAYDCGDDTLAVDSPAGDPFITAVGGTRLQLQNGQYGSEIAWSDPTDRLRSPKGAGGGGGISSVFAQPDWQIGPGVTNQYSNGKREVPDISANADPQTGYAVYCTVSTSSCPISGNIVVGGTSAAAPLWAASATLINQYLQKQGKPPLGFISPTLYRLASEQQPYPPFHDVRAGDNLYYPATPYYDLASGLGSPDVYNIARNIAAS